MNPAVPSQISISLPRGERDRRLQAGGLEIVIAEDPLLGDEWEGAELNLDSASLASFVGADVQAEVLTVDCRGVAGGGTVVDDCGLCGGDGSSCRDCNGVANGLAVLDRCNVCDADPTNDCTQDCQATWGGRVVVDVCGVCGGDGLTCIDCNGQPALGHEDFVECSESLLPNAPDEEYTCGAAGFDNCGTCDKDPSNDCTQDCMATWGGLAKLDCRGICEGNDIPRACPVASPCPASGQELHSTEDVAFMGTTYFCGVDICPPAEGYCSLTDADEQTTCPEIVNDGLHMETTVVCTHRWLFDAQVLCDRGPSTQCDARCNSVETFAPLLAGMAAACGITSTDIAAMKLGEWNPPALCNAGCATKFLTFMDQCFGFILVVHRYFHTTLQTEDPDLYGSVQEAASLGSEAALHQLNDFQMKCAMNGRQV
eukprot:SAG31_NODE_437_length_15714_cov_8.527344_16_plen_427_part_00